MRIFLPCLLLAVGSLAGQEIQQEVLVKGLREGLHAFESITVAPNKATTIRIELGGDGVKIEDKEEFDGFRFKVPARAAGSDLVWYFNVPSHWGHWYILPVEGEFKPGFKKWFNADKLYKDLDRPGEKDRLRALQSLESSYFEEGKEYVIWFHKVEQKPGADLRATLMLLKSQQWDHAKIEEALRLQPLPATDQVMELGSRGGKILLDPRFFEKSDGESRINSIFSERRLTQRFQGGFFITTESTIPPCKTEPLYAAILKEHGPADFIQTSEEAEKVHAHGGSSSPKDNDPPTITYYYDYVGFKVSAQDPYGKIIGVVTHANDFSLLTPKDDGAYYARIGMKNLTVFHKNNSEVGRLYYFLEDAKEPLVLKEPPAGRYRNEEEDLEFLGDGKWVLRTYFEDKKLARQIPFAGHRMNGVAQGYYRNGKKTFVASYKNGALDGDVIEYDEDEKETRRTTYKDGKRAAQE